MSTQSTQENSPPDQAGLSNWNGDLSRSPAMHAIQEAVERVEEETGAALAAQNRAHRQARARVVAAERERLEAEAARMTEQRTRTDEEAAQSAAALIEAQR